MVFEAVLGDEARAVVKMAIARLEATHLRFASKLEARKALDTKIADVLSDPFVGTMFTTEASALGDAIQRTLSRGNHTSIGRLWLAERPKLLGGGPAALADSQRVLDELLLRREAAQRRPAMLAAEQLEQRQRPQSTSPSTTEAANESDDGRAMKRARYHYRSVWHGVINLTVRLAIKWRRTSRQFGVNG